FMLFGFFALAAGMYLLTATTTERGHESPDHPQAGRPTRLRPLIPIYIGGICMGLAHRGVLSFMPLHMSNSFTDSVAPILVGGLLTALVLASGMFGQILGGYWGDRYARPRLMWLIILGNIPLLILMTYTTGMALVIMAIAWGVLSFAYQPVTNALISDFSSARQRGTLFGIFHGLAFGVGALAATLAGAVGDAWGTAAIFLVMGLLLIPGLWAGWLLKRSLAPL
ncbi:MAG: MFS transporter, partial [Candidatus Marinimicrobia bacterium]|nr:MFS transporter [Candidatus Neomarinimicrobiota bacterium]